MIRSNYSYVGSHFCRTAARNHVTGRLCTSRRFSGPTRESTCCWSVRRKGSPTLPFCSMWRALSDTAMPTSGRRVSRTFCSVWSCRRSCRSAVAEIARWGSRRKESRRNSWRCGKLGCQLFQGKREASLYIISKSLPEEFSTRDSRVDETHIRPTCHGEIFVHPRRCEHNKIQGVVDAP